MHGQLIIIQAVLDDVVPVLQQDGQAQEQHEGVAFAELLRRRQRTRFDAGSLSFRRTGRVSCGARGFVAW